MPITAVCPYCHLGRVRAPEAALGLLAVCPRCQNCFTIVSSPEPASAPPLPLAVLPRRVAPTVVAGPANATLPQPQPTARTARPRPLTPDAALPPPGGPHRGLALALVAVALGGVSLVLSQVPYGRGGAAAVASLGLLLGIGGLSVARRKRVVGALGGLLNGAALAVMIALPSWLGWPSWWPAPDADDSRTVKAVRYDGSAAEPAEWVDVATASWQLRDVRVTVSLAAMGPVELTGPEQKRRWTREDYLQVWVRVENVGVARRVDCQGWGVPPPGVLPRLTNAAGKVLAAQALTGEFQPAGRPRAAALFPGKQADYLLIFELPSDRTPFLRLELPGAAFGGTEAVKLHIPRSSLIAWSAP